MQECSPDINKVTHSRKIKDFQGATTLAMNLEKAPTFILSSILVQLNVQLQGQPLETPTSIA